MVRALLDWTLKEKYYTAYYRKKILYIFDKLETLPPMKGPKFVYVHIMSPHWPFVFDRDGAPADPEHFSDFKDKKYYLDQYIYISKKVRRLAESLIAKSETPPIIIIQSDHGPRGFNPVTNKIELTEADEWRRIFNAYYLPGEGQNPGQNPGQKQLHPAISPVNTFRVIFNRYFNAGYPLLED
jgi:hypothetical protein